MLTVFKLPQLPRSCSKRIINIFQISQLIIRFQIFDLYLESVQENSVYKESCVLKEK